MQETRTLTGDRVRRDSVSLAWQVRQRFSVLEEGARHVKLQDSVEVLASWETEAASQGGSTGVQHVILQASSLGARASEYISRCRLLPRESHASLLSSSKVQRPSPRAGMHQANSTITPRTPKRRAQCRILMRQVQNMLRQRRRLDDTPDLDRALLLNEPSYGVKEVG